MSIESICDFIRDEARMLTFEDGFLGAMRKLAKKMPESCELRYDLNSAVVVFAGDMIVLRIVPDRDWYGYTKRLLVFGECKLIA